MFRLRIMLFVLDVISDIAVMVSSAIILIWQLCENDKVSFPLSLLSNFNWRSHSHSLISIYVFQQRLVCTESFQESMKFVRGDKWTMYSGIDEIFVFSIHYILFNRLRLVHDMFYPIKLISFCICWLFFFFRFVFIYRKINKFCSYWFIVVKMCTSFYAQ